MSDELLTAEQAMRQAISRAELALYDGARVWLDIARELRIGGGLSMPLPRPLERGTSPAPDETAVLRNVTDDGE